VNEERVYLAALVKESIYCKFEWSSLDGSRLVEHPTVSAEVKRTEATREGLRI
jgi:hypothetical protein